MGFKDMSPEKRTETAIDGAWLSNAAGNSPGGLASI